MPDEVVTEIEEVVEELKEPKRYGILQYILFKLDRNIAISGLVAMGLWSIYTLTPESIQIANTIAGGLVGYIGGRAAASK